MKKILTITCHNVYNYGATLQEYALVTYLRKLGYDAKSIRYNPPYLSQHYNLWGVGNPRFNKPVLKQLYLLVKLPQRLKGRKRKHSFDVFEKKYLKTMEKVYYNNEELKQFLPQASAYICGSDQIWNHVFPNGKDPAFYLDFVPNSKVKISYAASIATDYIPDKLKSFYTESIERLDYISVREKTAVSLLEDLGIKNVEQVLDPVFLLDSDFWSTKFIKPINEKYIFIYDFDSNPQIENAALSLKEKFNYKIYSVNRNIKFADKNFWAQDPAMFLSLISQSQYTLTNSFHAVCFSIIFERPLLVFNRNENINTRMQDLLGIMGMSKNLIDKLLIDKLDSYTIDYDKVRALKENKIQSSKEFLNNALAEI